MTFGSSLGVTSGALALGGMASVLLSRFLSGLLFEIEPTDPTTLITATLLFLFVALMAIWVPARRAIRIDPMEALRYDG